MASSCCLNTFPSMDMESWTPAGRTERRAVSAVSGWTLIPLRGFLGFTFCLAGLQKLANPGFFTATNPASIQSQLAGAARRSPIHALIAPLAHEAVLVGLVIAVAELAIGIGALLGLWQRAAAAGGILLSLMLFLTVSFHSSPYYTGADIVFVFAWTPLLLAGAGPVLSADAALRTRSLPHRQADLEDAARRKAVLTTATAAFGLILGGLTAGLGRLVGGTTSSPGSSTAPPLATSPPSASPSSPRPHPDRSSGASHPAGHAIGLASGVPVGGSASFSAPGSGDPSIVLQPVAGRFLAFDAVCPHAGCTVRYDPAEKLIICPCHGSEFNPDTGAVEAGPALRGLSPIPVAESDGQLYAT
jgi:thiosulfate dehydrogenase [quinone] large subunit